MKTTSKALLLICILLISGCTKKDATHENTISTNSISQQINLTNLFLQNSDEPILPVSYAEQKNHIRTLVQVFSKNKQKVFAYLLTDYVMPDSVHIRKNQSALIITRNKIDAKTDLYNIDLSKNLLVTKDIEELQKASKHKYKIIARGSDSTQAELGKDAIINTMPVTGQHCVDWYLVTTDDATGEELSVEYLYTTCSSASGGGGNTGMTANIIKDNIKNPCIQSAFSLMSPNAPGVINSLLSDLGNSQKYMITISDNWTGGNTTNPAQTQAILENNTVVGYNIKLDGNVMNNFSKELITEIIYHEVVHAWLSTNGYPLGQHSTMLNTLLSDLVYADQLIYPQYSTQNAYANSLFGLSNLLNYPNDPNAQQDIATFNAALQAHGLTVLSMNNIYSEYASGDTTGNKTRHSL